MEKLSLIESVEFRSRRAGMSINELCRRAKVSRSAFTRWKSGDSLPTLRTLRKIEAALEEEANRQAPYTEGAMRATDFMRLT